MVHQGLMVQWGEEEDRATEDFAVQHTLNSELASSQRETCTHNVVVENEAAILICEKWVGCFPSGWPRPCWLSVGDKMPCMKVGLYADDGLTWNWCIATTEYGISEDLHFLLCMLTFVLFLYIFNITDDRHVLYYTLWVRFKEHC